jgi:proteasome assembly chaperone (PAC2) family protein
LPHYLIEKTEARQIGQIKPDGFYLFQFPGAHHFMRPEIRLEEGYRQELSQNRNEFFYWENDTKGLVIFLGDEPHLSIERYANAFLDTVERLGVQRVVSVGGVYGAMPHDKDRQISCLYSLPRLKAELGHYAVTFSDYEGGVTIGGYLADRAEGRGIELVDFYGFVPAYDLSQLSSLLPGLRIENDFKAWYDLMRRFNYMFDLRLDLADLAHESEELALSVEAEIDELEKKAPQLKVREHLAELTKDFTELSFMPLDDVWERELGDLFEEDEE